MNIGEIIKAELCTGCSSCKNVCPTYAISMERNAYAETIPIINKNICIDCGKCIMICHSVNEVKKYKPIKCLAAYSLNSDDQQHSASGGIASVISRKVIADGGGVCGVEWNEDMEAVHKLAYSEQELIKFKGSKYVESHLGDVNEIINVLRCGRTLLYIGTPCQVAAIKRLTSSYEDQLLTIDLVCHGVPPVEYFKEYIANYGTNITDARFRGEKDFWLQLYRNEECIYEQFNWYDKYFSAFMENLIFRECCYSCKYATDKRIGDFTLGDFWGLSEDSRLAKYKGRKSLVLLNTEKAKNFFNRIRSDCKFEIRSLDEAKLENHQLNCPSVPPEDREIFLKYYQERGFSRAITKTNVYKKIRLKKGMKIKNVFKQKTLSLWRKNEKSWNNNHA